MCFNADFKALSLACAFSIFTTSKYSHSKYSHSLCIWLDCPVACCMESEDETVFVKRHELLMEMDFRDTLIMQLLALPLHGDLKGTINLALITAASSAILHPLCLMQP